MHIVCIPAGHFRCIHLFRTVGDSNSALIINHFREEKRTCLRMFTNPLWAKNAGAIFAGGRLLHIFDERFEKLEELHRCLVQPIKLSLPILAIVVITVSLQRNNRGLLIIHPKPLNVLADSLYGLLVTSIVKFIKDLFCI